MDPENPLYRIMYGNGLFVAMNSGRQISTSPDGITWESQVSGSTSNLQGIGYGNGLFVAVGAYGQIVTSPDGITWTSRASGTIAGLTGIAFGNGIFLTLGEETLSTSTDGVNWFSTAHPGILQSIAFSFGAGFFIRFSTDNGEYAVHNSIDGRTWQKLLVFPSSLSSGIKSITYGNGTFLAVGSNGLILPSDLIGGVSPPTSNRISTTTTSTTTTTTLPVTSSSTSTSTSTTTTTSTGSTTSTTLYFREDFIGESLDTTRWEAFANGGNVVVGSGSLSLFTNQNTQFFPYVRSRFNPFPSQGDFSLRLGLRFLSATPLGSGFFTAKRLPDNLTFVPDTSSLGPISIWQGDDFCWVGMNGEVAYREPAPPLSYHDYEFRRRESKGKGVYEVYVDGKFIKAFNDIASAVGLQNHPEMLYSSNERFLESSGIDLKQVTAATLPNLPTGVWFGNPYVTSKPGPWASLQVDYLEVRTMDYSSLASTSTSTTSSSTTTGTSLKTTSTTLCTANPAALCLNDRQFSISVDYVNYNNGQRGQGMAVPLTTNSGYFWFFNSNNIELVVKILDGRSLNGKFWVLDGALSDVEYNIAITDTVTGAMKSYYNPPRNLAGRADVNAF